MHFLLELFLFFKYYAEVGTHLCRKSDVKYRKGTFEQWLKGLIQKDLWK